MAQTLLCTLDNRAAGKMMPAVTFDGDVVECTSCALQYNLIVKLVLIKLHKECFVVPSTFITHSHQITIKNNNITGVKKSLTDNMRNPINVRAVHDYHHIESSDTPWDTLQQNADLRTAFRNNSIEVQGLKACWSSRLWLQRVFTEQQPLPTLFIY